MVNCSKCGKSNSDDAMFCTNCGTALRTDVGATIERHAKQFAQTMEQAGKKVGDQMTQAAKQITDNTQKQAQSFEQRMDRIGQRAESWYERSFGLAGPLIESFIFLIVFRLIILLMEHFNTQTPEVQDIAAILLVYLLPFFALSLLSNYTQYFSKKFYPVKIFSPLLYAIFFVLFIWILSRILYDIGSHFSLPEVRTAAASLETSLPTIFVFVLLIGYVILAINLPKEQAKEQAKEQEKKP